MKMILVILAVTISVALSQGQVPTLISHQGFIADSTGTGVSDTLSLTFRLYTDSTGGILDLTQVFPDVVVVKGIFSVDLDVSSVALDKQYWLETEVEGQVLAPRTRLTSAPYSLAPWNPDTAGIHYNGGNVGIGINPAGYALDVYGGSRFDGLFGISTMPYYGMDVNASLTLMDHDFWFMRDSLFRWRLQEKSSTGLQLVQPYNDADVLVDAIRMEIDDEGRVGFGVTPQFGFDVNHEVCIRDHDLSFRRANQHRWMIQEDNTSGLRFFQGYNDAGGLIALTRLEIGDNGGVGIGTTTTPGYNLEVNGSFKTSGYHTWMNVSEDSTEGNIGMGDAPGFNAKLHVVSNQGYTIYAHHTGGGSAGHFIGNVGVTGTLSKGGGSFKIDHPLAPTEKWLYHSFVESPDMMNVYNGNITTDARGYATVTLPSYFEALNRDFRYQLTVIGRFAQAIVDREISDNQFIIRTDQPNVKVSWQVTGIRHDAFANAHRVVPEVDKVGEERGKYIHPVEHGMPRSMQSSALRHATPEIK